MHIAQSPCMTILLMILGNHPRSLKKNLIEINNEFFKQHTAEQEVALKSLDPNRFERFIPKILSPLLSFPEHVFAWGSVHAAALSCIFMNLNPSLLLFTTSCCVSLFNMWLLPVVSHVLSKYFFSAQIEQKHLEEAFLELKKKSDVFKSISKTKPRK